MKTGLIRQWDELTKISDQWNNLLSRSGADSIFLRWEWINTWKDTFKNDVEPFVVTVSDHDGHIIGLAPFYVVEYRLCKTLRYKVLRILADSASGSEYPAWIVPDSEQSDEVYNAIIDMLGSVRDQWDCLWMQGVRTWGSQARSIFKAAKRGFFINNRRTNSSEISLEGYEGGYIDLLSRNMRSQLRRDEKKVLTQGGFNVTKCVNEQDVDQYLDALFSLHDVRWGNKGLTGMFERRPKEVDFYRKFVPEALRQGWLRMYALHQEDTIKAVQLGYVYNNRYNQIQEGFDPAKSSGAGNTLRLYVMDECIREGLSDYDFLGEHTEHKRRWGGKARACYDLLIGMKSPRNMVLFKACIWPTGRFFKQHEKE